MSIGVLNHGMHDGEISYYKDNNGTYNGYIPEVVVTASEHLDNKLFNYASIANTIIDCLGTSLKKNSGNSTFGSNNKFYWHDANERGFYGNQYVKTIKLTNLGVGVKKATGSIGLLFDGKTICDGINMDLYNYNNNGYTNGYYTIHATAEIVGGWAGSKCGIEFGSYVGGTIGAYFGGIGAVPGAIIGGAVFGVIGTFCGQSYFSSVIDGFYGY